MGEGLDDLGGVEGLGGEDEGKGGSEGGWGEGGGGRRWGEGGLSLLPPELQLSILALLPPRDLASMALVSRCSKLLV